MNLLKKHTYSVLKNGKRLAMLLFFFTIAFNAFSLTIYVAPTGKDTNPGTLEKPFVTLQAAQNHVRMLRKSHTISEPVEITIAAGSYFLEKPLEFTAEDSGTAGFPLIIKGQKGTMPVFTGGIKLTPFEKIADNLWKIHIPEIARYGGSIQQLFVNGVRAVRARTPNKDSYFRIKDVSESLIDTNKQSGASLAVQKISLTKDQLTALQQADQTPQNTIISINHAWDRTRKYLQATSMRDSAVYITGRPMHSWNKLNNSAQFFFENAKGFLDSPGEWFLDDNGDLFYFPRHGEDIGKSTAIIPIIDKLLIIKGDDQKKVENIHFENISLQFTRYLMPFWGNENAQAAAPTEATVMVDHASNIYFDKCEISHTGNNAIWFRSACNDSKVTHSYFHDLGIGGVKIGEITIPDNERNITKNIIIDNNILRDGGHEFPTGVGVLIFQASDNTISHNDISDFRYSGVSVGWIWGYKYSPAKRNKIVYNHIHHLGWGLLSDMGGVYTLGRSEGTVVSNNLIHDIYSFGYGGWGLYTDEGSTGIIMENNLVYNCKSSGFHQHYGAGNIIRNNIFAYQIKAQLEATRVEKHQSFSFTNNIIYFDRGVLLGKEAWAKINAVVDSNLYWDTRTKDIRFLTQGIKEWSRTTGKDKHSKIGDPNFVNPSQYDFHFKNKSVISKIKFKPFDYTLAGVYGNESWKKLAIFNTELSRQFSKMVEKRLSEDEPAKNN